MQIGRNISLFVLLALFGTAARAQSGYDDIMASYQTGHYADCKTSLRTFIDSHPADDRLATATACLARCLYERADADNDNYAPFLALAASFHNQYSHSPQEPMVSFYEALVPYRHGKWAEARTALKNFVTAHPDAEDASEALFLATLCSATLGDSTTYTEDFSAFRARWPQSPHITCLDMQAATLPYHQGKWADARTALKQFYAKYPDAPETLEAQYTAALCSATLGDNATLSQDANAFRVRWPQSPQAKALALREAMLPYEQGKWSEARTTLKQCLVDYPDIPEAKDLLFDAARCSVNLHDDALFLEDARAFRQRWPDEPRVASLAFDEAMIPFNQGKVPEAHAALKQYTADYPNAPETVEALYTVALCSVGSGDITAFHEEVAALRARAPQSTRLTDLAYQEALIPYGQHKWEEAIAALEAFIPASTDDPVRTASARFNLGKAWISRANEATTATEPAKIQEYRDKGKAVLQEMRDRAMSWTLEHSADASPDVLGQMSLISIESLQFEGNCEQMALKARAMLARPGITPHLRAMGNLWLGWALLYMTPPDLNGARGAFQASLAANEEALNDRGIAALLTGYLISVTHDQKDDAAALEYMRKLIAMPDGPWKEHYTTAYPALAAEAAKQR